MTGAARRSLIRAVLPIGCAVATLCPSAASAQAHLFTPDTLELTGDVRLVGVGGEKSWSDGGFGKLRSGSDGGVRVQPQVGNLRLVWEPQFSWALSATVVAGVDGGQRTAAGLSQAFLSFRPMRSGGGLAFTGRAGLMWPPVSLEHEGADWHVRDSITPSAINSWIGEEVRPAAVEANLSAPVGASRIQATAAVIAANDTAGTLLTFRGWALHDRTTLAFNRQPLPPLSPTIGALQAPFTHPLIDLGGGFAHRPGYYAKLSWQAPIPVRLDLFRYDNRASPTDVNAQREWGWRTAFNDVGVTAELGHGAVLRAQALEGRTRMGYSIAGRRWIDNRFRSAFALLTRPFGSIGAAMRVEAFDARERGSLWEDEYGEHGWSSMLATSHDFGAFTGVLELLHVRSKTPAREYAGEKEKQAQTQLQAQVRMRW